MNSQTEHYRLRLPRRGAGPRSIAAPAPGRQEGDAELHSYLQVLADERWRILLVALCVALLAGAYALLARPVFEASMLIHVEELAPANSKNILNEVSSMFETKKAAIAEMELLRSRKVVAPAVENLQLFIDARPRSLPLVGALLRDARPGELSQPGLFGVGGLVWGDEQIEVPLFEVPAALHHRDFVITALGGQRFRVEQEDRRIVFYGRVGPRLTAHTAAGPITLQVTRLDGLPRAQFLLTRSSTMASIKALQKALLVTEQGKQSGVIDVRLEGSSPERVNAILQQIGQQYMLQNMARKSEEAEKSLAFLDQQLPKLKTKLEDAEAQYNQFRNRHGTIDLAEEAKLSLQQAAAARLRRSELAQKRAELLTRFTVFHPAVAAISDQIGEIDRELAATAEHIKTLPLLEQDALRLSREIKVDTDLYTALSNTAQQLRIVSVGKVSNVRMVDPPMVAEEPVRPQRLLIAGGGVAGGLLLGVACAFLRRHLGGAVEDPDKVEQLLGSRVVFASIPHSQAQVRLDRRSRAPPLLARDWPVDPAIEALRGFRASLQFSLSQFANNVVMFAGPTSGLGKSFVAANFAAVVAASGKRVLLIDGDVRNGRLHLLFGGGREHGLCEAMTGGVPLAKVVRHNVLDKLDFIATGVLPVNRPDAFQPADFGRELDAVRGDYDLVLIDSPPVLAVADALLIGAHAGAVFLVVRAAVTTEREITESIKRLNQAGVAPFGIVFNDVKPRLAGYGYRYAYGDMARLELVR